VYLAATEVRSLMRSLVI